MNTRTTTNSWRTVIALIVVFGVAFQSAAAETEVVWGHEAGTLTLDPVQRGGPPDGQFYYLIFDGLVQRPDFFNEDGSLPPFQPLLAHSWDVSDDGTVWTFYLREGVQFHGGYGEMTANDVKFSFERARDPDNAFPRRGEFAMVDEINVIDDYTVEFRLHEPYGPFLYALAMQLSGSIVSQAALEAMGDDAFGENPVGTGPYQMDVWESGGVIEVVAFDDHWAGRPEIDRVRLVIIPDQSVQALALLSGEVHKIRLRDQIVHDMVAGQPGVQVIAHPTASFSLWEIWLNNTREPLDNRLVRHALLHAIDREAIFDAFVGDVGVGVAHSMVRPSHVGHLPASELPSYDYDPERARELLAEAGYPDGFTVSVLALPQQLLLDTLTSVQEFWAEIGVTLEIDVNERALWNERLMNADYDMWAGGTGRGEVDEVLYAYHSQNPPSAAGNYSLYSNPVVDELIDRQQATVDVDERAAIIEEIQRIVLDDLPVLPIYYSRHVTGVSSQFEVTDNVFSWYFNVAKWSIRE